MQSFKKISILLFLLLIKLSAFSQCAMCRATIESDLAAGGQAGKSINGGIIYIMFVPYVLMITVGVLIYLHYQRNETKTI